MLTVAFCGCNHRSNPGASDAQQKAEAAKNIVSGRDTNPAQARAAQVNDSLLFQYAIKAIAVSPQNPCQGSVIMAIAETVPAELPQEVELHYVFWLNAAVAQDSTENILTLAAVKKNDFIYVDAVLMSGGRELFRKRSLMVKILNSSPRIESVDFPEIKGPGIYNIKVNAMDADPDPLSYTLTGEALPAETTIDSTGTVKITLSDKSPENIVFWVVVKDDDEGEARQEIKISFTKKLIPKIN